MVSQHPTSGAMWPGPAPLHSIALALLLHAHSRASWALITPAQASAWGTPAVASGEAERVRVEPGGGKKSPEAFGLAGGEIVHATHEQLGSLPPRLVIL